MHVSEVEERHYPVVLALTSLVLASATSAVGAGGAGCGSAVPRAASDPAVIDAVLLSEGLGLPEAPAAGHQDAANASASANANARAAGASPVVVAVTRGGTGVVVNTQSLAPGAARAHGVLVRCAAAVGRLAARDRAALRAAAAACATATPSSYAVHSLCEQLVAAGRKLLLPQAFRRLVQERRGVY
jgi:hypothetical protein